MFAALYEGDEQRLGARSPPPPEELVGRLRDGGFTPLAAGDGSVRFREVLEEAGIQVAPDDSRGPRGACAARLPPGRRGARRAAGGRSPRLSERPGRQAATVTPELEIRQLAYADLPQVIAIERRAFPTPWSLAMFVLELSKPSGICLAPLEDGVMVGYLVCSRYDTVWHLMNVAVDPRRRRQGIATALLDRLFEQADKPNEQYTLEVRTSNDGAIRLYERFGFRAAGRRRAYYHDNREDALIMWRTVERTHHRVILALETSCDDTCAAVVSADGEIASNVIASQGLLHARYGGVVPGDRLAPPPGARRRRHGRRARARRRPARRHRHRGGHARPGADRRAARGPLVREGARRDARSCRSCRWTTCTGTWWRARWARPGRAAVPLPRRQRRPHVPRARG